MKRKLIAFALLIVAIIVLIVGIAYYNSAVSPAANTLGTLLAATKVP